MHVAFSMCPAFASHLPVMATTSGGPWICTECGKVCKSHGGFTQHSSIHKQRPRIGELRANSYRVYHPKLDGMLTFSSSNLIGSNPLKESHVVQMENFFPLERHQPLPPRSLLKIGLLSYHVLDLNLLRFCTQRLHSQTTLLTISSAFGALH